MSIDTVSSKSLDSLFLGGFMFTVKNIFFVLTLISALGCALMAGVFFAFSTFVMKALNQIPANESISAMSSINVWAARSLFGAAFVVTPLICVITIIFAGWKWQSPASIYIVVGGIIYVVFSLLVTIGFNIPLNDALAAVAPNDPNNANLWRNFYDSWMFWNHVRTLGSLGATTAFIFALRYFVVE
jgi:uncharacterized membrane protein